MLQHHSPRLDARLTSYFSYILSILYAYIIVLWIKTAIGRLSQVLDKCWAFPSHSLSRHEIVSSSSFQDVELFISDWETNSGIIIESNGCCFVKFHESWSMFVGILLKTINGEVLGLCETAIGTNSNIVFVYTYFGLRTTISQGGTSYFTHYWGVCHHLMSTFH